MINGPRAIKILSLLSFSCLLFLQFGCGIKKELNHAKRLLEAGDFLQARKVYADLVNRFPDHDRAHYGLGMTWCAEAIYKTELGMAEPGDWYRAIYHLTIASNYSDDEAIRKTLAILHFNLGTSYRKAGRTDAAVKSMEQAIAHDGTLVKALNLLGTIYHRKGNYQQAEKYYRRVLTLKPEHAMVHFNLGALAWAQKEFESAHEYFQKAVEFAPSNAYFRKWLSKVQQRIER